LILQRRIAPAFRVRKREKTMRKLLMSLGLAAAVLSVTACNTVKGAGQDIQSVGQAGEDAID
jgi:predicted small secreted protein